ncbi:MULTISPECIES: TniQ family protein [Pseudoalteromonas]|uniref:TniQ domain-containing protein n=1 Tax=Pseudoalteromonas amylolytica TaxID=1859457 RepID=A0A1S1MZB8_9GAMM|nr:MULTISPECIES: TniQ family protein [Pseudoalteromonas]OHU90833.1 hypothetical protein BFC16_04340 [Pseudoalteromonas sp. JW3]OHU92547.1 hypothetical protein BET10_03550 [Pseudoalteromonas amylolytica]
MDNTLPVHPQPMPDELFSSWVYRAAKANGQNVFSFCHLLLPELNGRYYDIDNSVNEAAIQKLSHFLRTPFLNAWTTTLDSYAGLLFSRVTPKAKRKACILQTGITRYSNKRFCLQYCPSCLAEREPYYRKEWRISFVTVCTKHKCKLHDRCPQCHKPVKPLLNDVGQPHKMPYLGDITQCYNCGFRLSEALVAQADADLIDDTHFYRSTLKTGYCRLDATRSWVYSFSFFCVLRHLIYLLKPKYNHSINPDTMPLASRYYAMKRAKGFFKNWPSRLVELCEQSGIRYFHFTNMSKSKPAIPYWFDVAIRPEMYRPNYGPTKECVQSAMQYMSDKKLRMSLLQVNKLLGYRDSGLVKKFYKDLVGQFRK